MTNGKIKKLKLKIWLALWVSFFAITGALLVIIYLSHVSFERQQFQNAMHSAAPVTLEQILRGEQISPAGAFGIKLDDGRVQAIDIQGDTTFEIDDADQIMMEVRTQTGRAGGRIRDRFLWRIPTPFIEYDGRYWSYIPVFQTPENPEEGMIGYLIFWDATVVREEIVSLRNTFLILGSLVFVLIGTLTYLIAHLLVKPTTRAFEQQKQFIADVSHELKTPLTMIKNNLKVLRMDELSTIQAKKKWLDHIEFGYERMNHLVTDLLILSKLENQLEEKKTAEFDFSQVTNWMIESMKGQFDEKGIQFLADVEPNITVNQNADKIMQAMAILLDNSIKYVDRGGKVSVTVEKSHQEVTFKVENSGSGIPATYLPHIFDRFYRVEASRNSKDKGYGLGLSIAKFIIEQAGGKISATSIPEELTTVQFSIRISEELKS